MSTRAHGTVERYRRGPDEHDQPGPCRCTRCRADNRRVMGEYRLRKAQQQWGVVEPDLIDAEPARTHVRQLMAHGIGWERAAHLAGVAKTTVALLLYGTPTRRPSVRIRPETAARLLAVLPSLDIVADGARVDATGTRRRVQALAALGWTLSELARHISWAPTNMPRLADPATVTVEAATARLIRALYAELSMRPAPDDGRARRARSTAESRGWLPPLAWDDDLIDLPDAELAAELERRVSLMGDEEVGRCWTARYRYDDPSPLIAAGAREANRRRKMRQAAS